MTADLHALSGAYALDAVDDIERAAFTRHLADCEPCQLEVAEFREVTARLALDEGPPARMRDSVLAIVAQTRQVSPADRPERDTAPAARAERWRRATLGVAAAAVLAVVATWVVMDQRLSDEQQQVRSLRSERERIYAVMNAKDVQMRGADLPTGGRIAAAVSDSEHGGVAMLAGLSSPPAGQTYQMWVVTGATSRPAARLPVGVQGGTLVFDWTPGATAFSITREPEIGSLTPTMDALATIDLS
ncbi:anti-sigma factor domain-containing protein [Phytohabitans sp. LJ34]|uniref:anti-sigma factor n=1 Tax=Phytohabitans sp. LJ34 TaxID=3452217 RepID=UPI003F8CDF90